MNDDHENYGWALPARSRKFHYIDGEGMSLCGKYGFVPRRICDNEDPWKRSADDCVSCRCKFDVVYGHRGNLR